MKLNCRLVRDMPVGKSRRKDFPSGTIPNGTVLKSHRAHILIGMGVAEPADDECAAACGFSHEQMEEKQDAYPCLLAGIDEKDNRAFKFGAMTGYDPETGKWIEGPKYDEWMSLHNEENEED